MGGQFFLSFLVENINPICQQPTFLPFKNGDRFRDIKETRKNSNEKSRDNESCRASGTISVPNYPAYIINWVNYKILFIEQDL